ncbi:MAG: hypothetical protein JW874_01670 [Spirochaetales bacterium]|nr:hypothetical protein [Spirochaetales bacterium]
MDTGENDFTEEYELYEEHIRLRIHDLLVDIYGKEKAGELFGYLTDKISEFGKDRVSGQQTAVKNDPEKPWAGLAGKIFAIAYPDSISSSGEYTLGTLAAVLKKYFPDINGLHILPERPMCHYDVLEQDFYSFTGPEKGLEYIRELRKENILDEYNRPGPEFEIKKAELVKQYPEEVLSVLAKAWNYHFNDGGFSQICRDRIDPRFGRKEHLQALSRDFALMLDYVVNHLDIDNPLLESYRAGQGDGSAFIIIPPEEYAELVSSGAIAKTFRPRPFPLFTGLRKYPEGQKKSLHEAAGQMQELFRKNGLSVPAAGEIMFLALVFKLQNDQGLTAEDKRALDRFAAECKNHETIFSEFAADSELHQGQPVLSAGTSVEQLCTGLDWNREQAELFLRNEDSVFGDKFYIYTTFSESQCDINPKSDTGFRLIFDDLFHILASGNLTMLRMDAIKYLWKEIGRVNFDMDEGNKLAEVIKLTMRLAAPEVLALDEVNSPDRTVYAMAGHGGLYYLFGPVNTVSIAFNEQDLTPLRNLQSVMKQYCPPNLLLFIMLSTHDGRSVQGLGLQHNDGHVAFAQFSNYKRLIEANGGMAKYRSVARGLVPGGLLEKVIFEAYLLEYENRIMALFEQAEDGQYRLSGKNENREQFVSSLAVIAGKTAEELNETPAIDFLCSWLFEGRTEYELCATSRSSLDRNNISPEFEARRLALAQLYILTMGQHVPAIYFNDLLGCLNDFDGYNRSGKPRDLNRKKNVLAESGLDETGNDFLRYYLPLLNKMIGLRASDRAFFPGSPDFEEIVLSDQVFIHHAFHGGADSVIIGNISMHDVTLEPDETLAMLLMENDSSAYTDGLSGRPFVSITGKDGKLTLAPYSAYYLQKQ